MSTRYSPSAASAARIPGIDTDTLESFSTALDPYFRYHEQVGLENLRGGYSSLVAEGALFDRVSACFSDVLPGTPRLITLQRFRSGDSALPHRLYEALPCVAADVSWVSVCALTRSPVDGPTFFHGDRFHRQPDVPGRILTLEPSTWWWTSPVAHGPRYTIILGGRHA